MCECIVTPTPTPTHMLHVFFHEIDQMDAYEIFFFDFLLFLVDSNVS